MHGLHTCVLLLFLPQVATQELIRAGGKEEGIWEPKEGLATKIAGEERKEICISHTEPSS